MTRIFGPKIGGYTLQNAGNYFMENIIYFHDLVLCILFFISLLVSWFLITTLLYFGNPKLYFKLYNKGIVILNKSFRVLDLIIFSLYSFNKNKRYPGYGRFIIQLSLKKEKSIVKFLKSHDISYRYYFYSDIKLEFLWTLFPSIVLFLLAIPSFGLLFSVEKVSAPELTVKVIGHQWYWEYQYMDYLNFKEIVRKGNNAFLYMNKTEDNYIIESYMINDEDLEKGQFRLLEVDKKLVLPINTSIRLLITSDDVLHSWAVPALGIKVDACPGRINEVIIKIRDLGLYYGQCSELCGWYHGFMPIVIQSLNVEDYKQWALSSFLDVKYVNKTNVSE
jgi:cytochrome c oxidase subunit II